MGGRRAGAGGTRLVLAEPADERQARGLVIRRPDAYSCSCIRMISGAARANARQGVRFLEIPRNEPYGWVAVFEDNWDNRWDLLQLTEKAI